MMTDSEMHHPAPPFKEGHAAGSLWLSALLGTASAADGSLALAQVHTLPRWLQLSD